MLVQVKQNLARLDAQSYAELKSYKEPPRMIHLIVQAVLALFYPDLAEEGTFGDWNQCKPFISMDLGRKILEYDPMDPTQPTKVEFVLAYLKDIPRGSVANKGSKPADYIYNWLYICMNLLEHARTTARTTNAAVAPPAAAAAAAGERSAFQRLLHLSVHYCSRTVHLCNAESQPEPEAGAAAGEGAAQQPTEANAAKAQPMAADQQPPAVPAANAAAGAK